MESRAWSGKPTPHIEFHGDYIAAKRDLNQECKRHHNQKLLDHDNASFFSFYRAGEVSA
jgi:hypothetical protein